MVFVGPVAEIRIQRKISNEEDAAYEANDAGRGEEDYRKDDAEVLHTQIRHPAISVPPEIWNIKKQTIFIYAKTDNLIDGWKLETSKVSNNF